MPKQVSSGGTTAPAEVSAIRYGRAVRRRWPVILVLTVLGMAAGYLTAKPARATNPLQSPTTAAPDVYSATALLMPIAPSGVSQGDPSGLSLDAMA